MQQFARKKKATGRALRKPSHRKKSFAVEAVEAHDFVLRPAHEKELARRIRDVEDRKRYLLASVLASKFRLFYDVSSDTYIWKDPLGATLFKRRAAAMAIKRLLGDGVEVVECRVDRRSRLVISSVQLGPVTSRAARLRRRRRRPRR